jgi:hypothetical protein
MIDRNIGTVERIVRLVLSVALVIWVALGDQIGVLQACALLAALALLWNSVFSRCYLWGWLGISSCKAANKNCPQSGDGSKV